MATLLIDGVFLAFASMVGVAAGLWLAGGRQRVVVLSERRETPAPAASRPSRDKDLEEEAERISLVMSRLHELATSVAADVDKHNSHVQRISDDLSASDFDSKVVAAAVAQLIEANKQMQNRLNSAEDRLQEQARQIETHAVEARTDALTQIANRRALDAEIARCANDYYEKNKPFCIMILDVDHFKKFNDTHGHQAGDEVLRGVAKVLQQNVSDKEFVARYGGEEFSVVFPGSSITEAKATAERARSAVSKTQFQFEGTPLRVTASAGLAQLCEGETVAMLVRRADDALYESKSAGRDCGHWHDGKAVHPFAPKPISRVQPTPPAARPTPQSASPSAAGQPAPAAAAPAATQPTAGQAGNSPASKKPAVAKAPEKRPVAAPAGASLHPLGVLQELPARSAFCEDVDRRLSELKRGGAPFSMLMISVDQLAQIKDRYGAEAAETALRATTQLVKAAMRSMDYLARYDEDLFSLTLPGFRAGEAVAFAERVRGAVGRCKLPADGHPLQMSISIAAVETSESDSRIALLVRAKSTLDAALRNGGNCTFVHDGRQCCPAEDYQTAFAP